MGLRWQGGGNKRCREIGQLLLQRSQLSGEALNLRPRRRHGRPRRVIGSVGAAGPGGGGEGGGEGPPTRKEEEARRGEEEGAPLHEGAAEGSAPPCPGAGEGTSRYSSHSSSPASTRKGMAHARAEHATGGEL